MIRNYCRGFRGRLVSSYGQLLQMLENTWRETEYRLDTLRATKGAMLNLFSILHLLATEIATII